MVFLLLLVVFLIASLTQHLLKTLGLIAVTGVKSRFVVAASGVILILLGLFPKLATIVASIPNAVLGSAGIAMFGMIVASGIRSLARLALMATII